jgi:DNA adenine methylase
LAPTNSWPLRSHYRAGVTSGLQLRTVQPSLTVKPFLKWPGGKRWLLARGLRVPVLAEGAFYHEPFLGGGAFYFALLPERAILSDVNEELISTYRSVRSQHARLISELSTLLGDRSTFDRLRSQEGADRLSRAVRMIYLNRTAYGGIYRVNRAGHFNVPFGNYADRRICQPSVLTAASHALQPATLKVASFTTVRKSARSGDLAYFDPPYTAIDSKETFDRYHQRAFTWDMQQQLASVAEELAVKGVHVLVSNTAHPDIVQLYRGFTVTELKRQSQVSRDVLRRGLTTEALFSSYPNPIAGTDDASSNVRSRRR